MNLPHLFPDDAPAVVVVNDLVRVACQQRASDVHCEPYADGMRIRLRIDGVLYEYACLARDLAAAVTVRIKIIAQCDIAESRLPQDGAYVYELGDDSLDVRVSIFPCLYGEKLVLRLLQRKQEFTSLSVCGFSDNVKRDLLHVLARDSGFLIVTGPTGSGKTTTLYAALSELISSEKNIVTLEDPVEYRLDGVTQGSINPDIGFTFARGLRALVRQDPDVILIGEIRDAETADIAIRTALTGHLVMSTLHTADAVSACVRLLDLGVAPFLLGAAVTGVVAQRLVRMLCKDCAEKKPASVQVQEFCSTYGVSCEFEMYPRGCAVCNKRGYKGRTVIAELCAMSPELSLLLQKHAPLQELRDCMQRGGYKPMAYDAAQKIADGLITYSDVIAVL